MAHALSDDQVSSSPERSHLYIFPFPPTPVSLPQSRHTILPSFPPSFPFPFPAFPSPPPKKKCLPHTYTRDDLQVAGELRKMVAFIKQEALEKAREIQIKADEEFAIEKSRLVRAETAAIDAQYERKFKQASLSQQISQSTVTNKTRLKVLTARQALLDDIFEQARGRLADISRDEGAYEAVLVNLVLEGLYALNESTLEVLCREKDIPVTGRAVKTAQDMFKEKTGGDCAVTIAEDDTLADESYDVSPPSGVSYLC